MRHKVTVLIHDQIISTLKELNYDSVFVEKHMNNYNKQQLPKNPLYCEDVETKT